VLEIARAIRYVHSSGINLLHKIEVVCIFWVCGIVNDLTKKCVHQDDIMMDSNSRARILGQGQFLRTAENPSSSLKWDLLNFGRLFYEASFSDIFGSMSRSIKPCRVDLL
jgi:hypothetical protein